ncbi:MAG: DUF881 domain-containing protein [Clostridium sp.]|uniref:DUF881 domain-containing protein n=1 Tax=Clostridium sp. TaxID=1506 RepID=UPI0030407E72
MRVNEANIFLFIATIIIGVLISMNINLTGQTKFLDVEQYKKAYDERTKIQTEIRNLEEEYDKISSKIEKYENVNKPSAAVIGEIRKELDKNRLILGSSVVIGDGVKITLNDAPEVRFGGKYTNNMLIHDKDLVKVINDLRNAGAEAIEVNGYRVTQSSYGLCSGATIELDGIKIIAPFYITAIGNKEVIEDYIENQENHIKTLRARGCYVEKESVYDKEISKYNADIYSEFLKPKEK